MQKREYVAVSSAEAWKGSEVDQASWLYQLTDDEIAEVEANADRWISRDRPMESMTKADFVLPTLAGRIDHMAERIENGHGFALIRGLPIALWSTEKMLVAYWGISLHLGQPVSQNKNGDLLNQVRDIGAPADDLDVRGPSTNAKLHYHSDFSDIVGLMCVHPAKSGGTSRICSSLAVYNALLEAGRTDLIDALYDGYVMDRKGEQKPGLPPVTEWPIPMLCRNGGKTYFRYIPGWVLVARERTGTPWTKVQQEAVDEVNRLTNDPAYYLDMSFQPGDIQFLNNYKVLHSRTAFEDYPEPERKRLLYRVWLQAERGIDLPVEFDHLFGPTSARMGIPAH